MRNLCIVFLLGVAILLVRSTALSKSYEVNTPQSGKTFHMNLPSSTAEEITVEIPRDELREDMLLVVAAPVLHENSQLIYSSPDGRPGYLTGGIPTLTLAWF